MSMADEERRSKLAGILTRHFPFSHSYMLAVDEIEALYAEEKPKVIDAGKQYRCIKDFYMDEKHGGDRVFTEGKTYSPAQVDTNWETGCSTGWFTNDLNEKDHGLSTDDDLPFFDYFEEVPE